MVRGLQKEISDTLLSASPDVAQLQVKLEKDLSLSPEDAQTLLYEVTAKLNATFFPAVTSLELILTEGCNLACSYCFEKYMLAHKRMPLEIARSAVDLLFDYSRDEKDLSLTHFGGEPMMNFQAVKYVTEYAEEKAALLGKTIHFRMTTNGTLLNENNIDYLVQHKIGVLVSIDGLRATHDRFRVDKRGRGTFDKVIKGLEMLKRSQKWIGVKITVMPENAQNLFNDVLGLRELGVNQFVIGYATGI